MTTTVNKNSFLTPTDLKTIEDNLKSGKRVTVKDLASQYSVKVSTMRIALQTAFYGRIVFKRGRTGGIMLTVPASP